MAEFDAGIDQVTVRDQDGRLLGIGHIHLNGKEEAQIRFMVVVKDYRGFGASLVNTSQVPILETVCQKMSP